jgi:hypothetical protein
MRLSITVIASASLALVACIGDRAPTEQQPVTAPKGPLFDHVGGVVPTVDVDANNYVLHLGGDHLLSGSYKGKGSLFAGELSYGNAPDAVVFYNASATGGPRLQGTGLPIEIVATGLFADHQTVSLLVERTSQDLGPAVPVGLIVVRETFAFRNAPDDDYVILKYTLYNPRTTTVENLHVGQILDVDLDTDLGDFSDNMVEYDATGDLVRVRSSLIEATPLAGHAVLRLPATSYRAFSNPGNPPGLTPHDPQTTAAAFEFLSEGIVDPGPFGPGDIRHALSHGPVTIRGGEAEVFAFVLAGGDDADDLAANVAAARAKYVALPHGARRPYPVIAADVAIAPSTLDLETVSEFTATLTGIPRKLVPLVDASRTFCGAPPATTSPATALVRVKNGVRVTFPVTNLFTRARPFRPGDEIVCGGRLSDGTVFAARTTPSVVHLAPVTRLTSVGFNRAPTWSPDGSSIAFSSDRSGAFAIWRMSVTGGEASAVQVTSGPDDHAPDWFGSTIVFNRGPALGAGEIYAVPDIGGTVTLINADGTNPRYSPDGATIAFTRVTDDFHVWTMAAAGGGETPITSGGLEFHPEWSPDGSEIFYTDFGAFRSLQGAIFRVVATGGAGASMTPDEGTDNRHPAVSPDGRWLAFTSSPITPTRDPAEIVLQDLTTGLHTVVPLPLPLAAGPVTGAERNQNLEFSPDGKRLLFAADGQIWVVDLSEIIP